MPECVFGDPRGSVTIVLWGDSHANHWVVGLDHSFKRLGIRGVERGHGGCPPALRESQLLDENVFGRCKRFGDAMLLDLARRRLAGPIGVILSARWAAYVNDEPLSYVDRIHSPDDIEPGGPAIEHSLNAVVTRLASLRIPVGILLQVPEQKLVVPICLRRRAVDLCETSWAEEGVYLREQKAVISRVAMLNNALLLDPAPYLCRDGRCRVREGDVVLYSDDDHLSQMGSRSLSSYVSGFAAALRTVALASYQRDESVK